MVRVDEDISRIVKKLYTLVNELETRYPQRRFTLDGHLVGSIGEVLAADRYSLKLLPHSAERHDALSQDGRKVQIKATQRNSIALRNKPEHLLVLKLNPDGSANEVYNGPGELVWEQTGKLQKNGQRPISVSKLIAIMVGVDEKEKLQAKNM